jgi:hypothetical protein
VPIRLTVMNRLWSRDALRYVDGWACRHGTPEDDEDREKGTVSPEGVEMSSTSRQETFSRVALPC